MSDNAMINFQIFPSQYEENGDGEKCCWLGGQLPTQQDLNNVQLKPYQTDAIPGRPNPDWGFHLLDVPGEPEKYRLKYVKMSDPDHWWYGVTVNEQEQLVLQETEGIHFTVRKLGAYYTLEYNERFVESDNGNLGATTLIKTGDTPPPPPVTQYDAIPKTTFRVLWKFIKMDHMSGREWQTKLLAIDKDLTIDKIFFPGTHDSGTEGNTTDDARCQYHTIPEQCAMGVRYFDLRVADDWDIYHGIPDGGGDSGINLKDVLDAVIDHLKNHGEEFFILQVTPETSADFSKRLNRYLIDNFDLFINNYAYTTSVLPTLDTAKGKIIFFARGYEPIVHDDSGLQYEYHIGWKDNIPGGYSSSDPFPHINVWVQDRYDLVPDSTKFDEYVNPALKKMFVKDHNNWIINFCSVANGGPLGSSEDINPWVANRLMWTPSQPTGLLMLDGARVGSIANIIALNFS